MLSFPLLAVEVDGNVIGHLLQTEATSHNRFGGTNHWEVIYASFEDHSYDWVELEDSFITLYNKEGKISQAKRIFSGHFGGERKYKILVKDHIHIQDFILKPVSWETWQEAIKSGLTQHFWDGKLSELELHKNGEIFVTSRDGGKEIAIKGGKWIHVLTDTTHKTFFIEDADEHLSYDFQVWRFIDLQREKETTETEEKPKRLRKPRRIEEEAPAEE